MAKSLVKLLATVEPLIASSLIVCMCVCQNADVIHIRLASNDKSIIYFLYPPIEHTLLLHGCLGQALLVCLIR